MQEEEIHRDVIVIGAGWSGLCACKYMLEEGLSVVALEKREDIGGVWLYTEDPTIPSVMRATQCTSSSTVTEMSDYPMPEEIGMFPHHTDVLEYLRSYAREFNLLPHIKFNSAVKEAVKRGNAWRVTSCTGQVYTSSYLVSAAGVLQEPNREPEGTILKGFTGKILHHSETKYPLDEFKDCRVLLLGGGEMGSDLVIDWFYHSKFIYWSIPRGQHFFRKYSKIVPWGTPQALDKASSRAMKSIAPFHHSKPGLAWVCKWTTNGSIFAYQGHGIPEWKNKAKFFKFFINKNGKVLDLVDYERLVPKGGILECKGREVTFVDGTKQEFDLMIMSTSYNVAYHYLPKRYAVGIRERFKMVFDVEDPSLAFVGMVRPIVGSIPGISELQARWAAKVFSGKVPLKPVEERRRDVQADIAHWSNYFKHSSQRVEGLVEGFTYIDDIARQAQIYPDYWSLFKKSPGKWFVAFFSPYNGATFRLNEPENLEKSINTMKRHKDVTLGPLQYLLIMFLRFFWIDWLFDMIGEVKYWIQVSSWWPTVRSWRVTKGLNHIWTWPRRAMFDTVSNDVNSMSPRAKQFMKSHKYVGKHLTDCGTPLANGTSYHSNGTGGMDTCGTQPKKRNRNVL